MSTLPPPSPEPHAPAAGGIAQLFNLRQDLEDAEAIDASVRAGVDVAGTNLWVLFFAILIASVGLNVNSTAVIIGAMLISPLMGPIVGAGYGLAVHDAVLIRRALRNLLIFASISLATSTLYFAVSPLRAAGTELLARTTPNLWDVLIAFFGGSAGIIALTRKSISNVIPGVAIATALMPPLCTVGFGMSHGDWGVAGGAFYLFVINGVFIAFSTFLFVKLMKLPMRGQVSSRAQRHATMFTVLTALAVTLPSGYLAWRFVQTQRFLAAANAQVELVAHDSRFLLLDREVDPTTRTVRLTLSGDRREEAIGRDIAERLAAQGFKGTDVAVRFSGSERVDVAGLKRELREDVFRQVAREADELRNRVQQLQAQNRLLRQAQGDHTQLIAELQAQLPQATRVLVGVAAVASAVAVPADLSGSAVSPGAASASAAASDVSSPSLLLVHIELPRLPGREDQRRLARWLAAREPRHQVVVDYATPQR
ncbi:DUF389 domain-containing protein [Roseateles sp. BYS96W]|uniref:DUF389 domain-containing protein n=1 Tax=Pelomonas nitida TaxID=3299027 RepID=A0ABW7G5D7_9BURK